MYYLQFILMSLLLIDIGVRTVTEYIPAYHLQKYVKTQKEQFNITTTKIINVVESTELAINTFQMFFENSFLKSICNTDTGKSMLGYVCTFSRKRDVHKNITLCKEKETSDECFVKIVNTFLESLKNKS